VLNVNAEGQSPLHTFPTKASEQILSREDASIDIAAEDNHGMTILHYAAWSSKTSVDSFRRAHERSGIDLESVDREGRSVLHLSCQRGNLAVIKYIIETSKYANLRARDYKGRTVLHYAILSRRVVEIISILGSKASDLWECDCQGISVLEYARRAKSTAVIKALHNSGMANDFFSTSSLTADSLAFNNIPSGIQKTWKSNTIESANDLSSCIQIDSQTVNMNWRNILDIMLLYGRMTLNSIIHHDILIFGTTAICLAVWAMLP
jgi:ankyrin repeat protein